MEAWLLTVEGRVDEGSALLEEIRRQGPAYRETIHLDTATCLHALIGAYPTALAMADESARVSPVPRLRRIPGMAFAVIAAVELGDEALARRHLARADSVLRGRHWQCYLPIVEWARATIAYPAGRPAERVAHIRSAAEWLVEHEAALWGMPVLLDLAEAAAEAADSSAAAWAAETLAAQAAASDVAPYYATAATGSAWAALARGDVGGAVEAAEGAVGYAAQSRWPVLQGRAHHVLGIALADRDPGLAAAALQEAADWYERCGARPRRERVLDLLRGQGSAGRRALGTALGPDSLTPRERDVARLAAQGQTAREIGAALFVGERTVETHLRNAYAKLGVDSKLDLVRRAADLGLS